MSVGDATIRKKQGKINSTNADYLYFGVISKVDIPWLNIMKFVELIPVTAHMVRCTRINKLDMAGIN